LELSRKRRCIHIYTEGYCPYKPGGRHDRVQGESAGDKWRTLTYAINEATGRKITIRSAQRLRAKVEG
jgi:hypothetical protein